MSTTHPLGIDVGGTGIKGAPVDLRSGEFAAERLRIETPKESTPDAVADIIEQIVDHFKDLVGEQPIGVTLPSVVTHGVVRSAANIDQSWIGTNVEELLQERLGRPATVLNDADAAGVGELRFGAARNTEGLVLVSTLGTGIGSALLNKGQLVPNSELGHLEIDGHDAESKASSNAKEREDLSWEDWAERLQRYYSHVEDLLWPDLIVVGGGVSKKADKFLPLLHLRAPIVAAQLRNAAGIVGAAYEAVESAKAEGTHRE
ncbi:polyphosphate--glucose phosphotransferase [Allobranchiibius sp. CTAmp26]|uniref:polyphosphate--glucose phosphotransferase n=1 Tax=Allobranchiibius sp. CTAmp26 TaxID=2815214 RepID=UPI001AA0CCB2|nr:ROK family protein [Allobranchiibius sp. CTAmp26]MBO1754496.1 ROK family protein [Allobranchiibius sp. CTAmp26]